MDEDLDVTYVRRIEAQAAADEIVDDLVEQIDRSDGLRAEDLELLLAVASVWLPQAAPRLRRRWLARRVGRATFAAAAARRLQARRRFGEVSPEELYMSAEALFRNLRLEERDPLAVTATLHVYFTAMRQLRLGLDDLSRELGLKARRALSFLRLHLASGDYRKGTLYCSAPELLPCVVSEMWRETVPLAAELRSSLEQAIRWELEVEAAGTPVAHAALMIAAENLHLKGVDPREKRCDLLAQRGPCGSFQPLTFRLPDGSVYAAGALLGMVFVARALAGQPRTGFAVS